MIKKENEIVITEEESKFCKICNKLFGTSKRMILHSKKDHNLDFEQYVIQIYYNGIRPVCIKTGRELSFKGHKLGPWFSNYAKNCFPRKAHSDETKQKIKIGCEKTFLDKYGVSNVFATDWCKDKIKKTMVDKYGVDNIMHLEEMKEHFGTFKRTPESFITSENTSLSKYGKTHYSKTSNHRLNIRKKVFYRIYKIWEVYQENLKELKQNKIICNGTQKNIDEDLPLKFKCLLCSCEWIESNLLFPDCPDCKNKFQNSRSKEESTLMKWLKEATKLDFSTNKRFNINDKVYEADVCFEDKKLIIELNGLFWHSEKAGKDRNYHINKLRALESLGYDVIQIFEDEWLFKTDIIKSKLLHKLQLNNLPKIYARKCEVRVIDNNISNKFLDETHIQGGSSASYCYGSYYNDELIAVMTFSKPRIIMGNKKVLSGEYEMIRFSTSNKYRIIGVAGKLLNKFIADINPIKIITYADRRWTNEKNNLYKSLGFNLLINTSPNYWYVKKYKREYRFNYTKKKLIKMGHDENKTEKQIMEEIGYNRIWDCGHLKYQMIFI